VNARAGLPRFRNRRQRPVRSDAAPITGRAGRQNSDHSVAFAAPRSGARYVSIVLQTPNHTHATHLRLAITQDDPASRIGEENSRAAAQAPLIASDPRWVLAARVFAQLDHGALEPQRRQRLIELAQRMGIRPFDAQVIIALVQDRARRGEHLHSAAPALAMIDLHDPAAAQPAQPILAAALFILGSSVLLTLLIARWILGA